MRARSLVVVSLLALVGAAPAGAWADEPALDRAWSAPVPLDPGWLGWDASIAGLAPGRTVVVRANREDPDNEIVASVLDAATGFESEQLLDIGSVYEPALDASFHGGAVAAWLNEADSAIYVSERRAGRVGVRRCVRRCDVLR